MLGILGGMGPLATVDFMQKVIMASQVNCDQQHMPMMVRNVPQIPDRTDSILFNGDDPYPALLEELKALETGGSECVVMPCNTAHYWFCRLQEQAHIPMISIIGCVRDSVRMQKLNKVGLMATSATVATGLYSQALCEDGVECIVPSEPLQKTLMQGIQCIKVGKQANGCRLMETVFKALIEQGAEAIILGCTEIPIGLANIAKKHSAQCIDATALLAEACVQWYYGGRLRAA